MAATSVGTLALFAGGEGAGGAHSDTVDIYDDSTGLWTTSNLSLARRDIAAVTLGSKAIFAGGLILPFGSTDVVDIYDSLTDTWTTDVLSISRALLGGASVGHEALFAGGIDLTTFTAIDVVDIYDDAIGTPYCSPATPNSTGLSASITAQGFPGSAAQGYALLSVSDLPSQSFGYFLTSSTQGFTANPAGSQGNLCLAGAIGRYVGPGQVQNSGRSGTFGLTLDLANHPQPTGAVSVQPGQTWNFQAWYRDVNPGPTSNFTDAVAVTFL